MVEKLLELKPDLVISEKGVSGTFYLLLSFFSLFPPCVPFRFDPFSPREGARRMKSKKSKKLTRIER